MEKDIILIFGGDGKIAQEIVQRYLEHNCTVIAVDKKEKNSNSNFNNNPNYYYYSSDVTSVDELNKLYKKISEKFSYVTHIISSAGGPFSSEINGIFDITFEDIEQSIKLNLISHIYIVKIFLPLLQNSVNNNKSILLFSSLNALKSFDLPAYSAGKSGIFGFVNSIVRDIGTFNIRINTITPGTVATPEEIANKYYNYKYKDMMALDQFTSPKDIADVCFSLSHITKAITGQNIIVDYGQIT